MTALLRSPYLHSTMFRRLLLCFLLSFSLIASAFSQKEISYHLESFTTENGLPSNGIKGLQWDESTGFLWIATEAGIVRYNGLSFKTFTPDDEPHIANERILSLVKNNAGRIITADNTGNVFEVDRNRLRFRNRVNFEENKHRMFALVAVSEALYNSPASFSVGQVLMQFVTFFPVSDTAVFFIYNNGLYRHTVSGRSPVLQTALGNAWFRGFKVGREFFLMDTLRRVYRYVSPTLVQPVTVTEEGTARSLNAGPPVWTNGMAHPLLFAEGKAWQLAYTGNKLTAQLIFDNLPADLFVRYAQYSQKRQTLVIGTDSKGILVIGKNKVTSVKSRDARAAQRTSYYGQVELPSGNVLTNEGHAIGPYAEGTTLPVKGRFSLSVYNDGDSALYYTQHDPAMSADRLYRYRFGSGQTQAIGSFNLGDQCLMQRTGGALYAVHYQGIGRLQGDSLFYLYRFPSPNPVGSFYDVEEMSEGVLAIAACKGLLRYTVASGKLDTLFNAGSYCVRTVWKYKDYFFIGTYGAGLYAYKKGQVTALPLDKSKYLLYTHCFIKDANDNCWISTNKGLFKVPLAGLTEAVDKKVPQLYYHYFGKADGMKMTELNGGCKPCAVAMKNGMLSFPSMDGLLWVNPKTAATDLPEGEIYADDILADSARLAEAQLSRTEIPFGTSELLFRISFPAWCNRENIYLDYQLNDDSWKPLRLNDAVELRFGNLPEGKYRLRLRKLVGFGLNNYTYKEFVFMVATPWHRRPAFYILGAVLLLLTVLGIFRWRTRQLTRKGRKLQALVDEKTRTLQKQKEVLEKADRIKTRLISIISHDIVTPLKFLTSASRNLAEKRTLMDEELLQETLEEMMNTSGELQQLSTNILNWIKFQNESRRLLKESFNLHRLVADVMRVFGGAAREKGLLLVNRVDENLAVHQFLEPLKIVIHNLLANAINFSEKGLVTVEGHGNGTEITIAVSDEGAGMTREQMENILGADYIVSSANAENKKGNGLGYLIVKDLLKMLHGRISIESNKGSGTTVRISWPRDAV